MAYEGRLPFCQRSLVKFLLVMLSATSFAQENPKNSKPANFVDKIRRQLMQDNYDYLESAEGTTTSTTTAQYDDFTDTTETPFDPWSAVRDTNEPSHQTDQDPQGTPFIERSNNFGEQRDYFDERQHEQTKSQQKQTTHDFDMYYDQENKAQQTDTPDYRGRDPDQYPNDINKPAAPRHDSADYLDNNGRNTYPKLSSRKQDYGLSAEDVKPATGLYDKRGYYDDGNIKPHTLEPRYDLERGFSVGQQDLLYYIDDKRMRRKGDDNMVNSTSVESEDSEGETTPTTTSKAKYKMIKAKGGPHRRNMAARRFVEEKNAEGVEIFRLDDEPFPQFRLPRGRRQYMYMGGAIDPNDLPDSDTSS